MTLPNLVGCGAGKSGTTSLYYYLSQHPQIFMTPTKEVNYFTTNFHKGENWYRDKFRGYARETVIGEFSPSYMLDPAVPARIAELIPRANLLFIFRNPIERAYSNYWFSLNIGAQDPGETFPDAIRSTAGYQEYVAYGYYYEFLLRFLKYFDRKQIHVMITEDLKKEPMVQMLSCYKYLGVDTSFVPDLDQKYNITVTSAKKWKKRAERSWFILKKVIRPFSSWIPTSTRRQFSRLEQRFRMQILNDERPPILKEDREYLANIFQDHNSKLANFLGRELPWD